MREEVSFLCFSFFIISSFTYLFIYLFFSHSFLLHSSYFSFPLEFGPFSLLGGVFIEELEENNRNMHIYGGR